MQNTKMTYILPPSQLKEIISQINSGEISYADLPLKLRHHKLLIMAAIKKDPSNIHHIPAIRYDDPDVMLELVKYDGSLLWYASDDLIRDPNIVLAAVAQDGMALEFVWHQETVFEYKGPYVDGYDSDGPCVCYEPEEIIDDTRQILVDNEEIASTAVAQNGYAFKYISPRLQVNKKIAGLAINQNGEALQFMSPPLSNDPELIMKALCNTIHALKYVPYSLRDNIEEIIKNAREGNIEYFYTRIMDGTISLHTQMWVKLLSHSKRKELSDWVEFNTCKYSSLFKVLFYKTNSNKRIGNFIPVRNDLILHLTGCKHKAILEDIKHACRMY